MAGAHGVIVTALAYVITRPHSKVCSQVYSRSLSLISRENVDYVGIRCENPHCPGMIEIKARDLIDLFG